ncbi:tetratricopeptide repeat protein [Colwellia piezophila]|uniref:tetratricopeptide repeat protein n=1 Tax=Colwellia piezophila TaxID=211668 RepID=UPI00037E6B4B|nr:tetratricopeptide repeat protein [Colwellia piezophila]
MSIIMNVKKNLHQAKVLYQLQDYDAAIKIVKKIVENIPNCFAAHNLLAFILQAKGQLPLAESTFITALAIDDSAADTFHQLASLQKRLRKPVEAEKNYQRAIAIDNSRAGFFFDYGLFLGEQGKFEQALAAHLQVLEIDNSQSEVYLHIFKHFMHMHRYQDALEIADIGLLCQNLTDFQLYELLIGKAILFWLFDNVDEAVQAIVLSDAIHAIEDNNINLNNRRVFHTYIKSLLLYRQNNSSAYQDVQQSDLPLIYFISESHGFSTNGMTVTYQQQNHLVKSLFIWGTKIVHLIQEDMNQYQASLTILLKGLPTGSNVVLAFGEIDCRTNEGIFKYCNEQGLDFHAVVDGMVEKYFNKIIVQAKSNNLNIILYGVPAPHAMLVELLTKDQQNTFKQMIAYLNQQLADYSDKENIEFLDVYQLTNLDGLSNLEYHIDSTHVNPGAVPRLFELLTPKVIN